MNNLDSSNKIKIKPESLVGTLPIGGKDINIGSDVVPSSPPASNDVIENKLNEATKKNTFQPEKQNESNNDK